MTEATAPYRIEPVLETVLAPFERWAKAGYAEGVIEFLPSLGRTPLLMSPYCVASVFDSTMTGLDVQTPSDEDKAEAERRFEFCERLLDEMMTRENSIRQRHHEARMRGMTHRTIILLCLMAVFIAVSVSFSTVGSIVAAVLIVPSVVAAFWHFKKVVEESSNIYLKESRAPLIIRELPWMRNAARISPRAPLDGYGRTDQQA